MSSLDKKIPVDAIYLDFSKAFDTVPHKRLLTKLEGYGVKGKVLNWIKDFLTGRTQYVSINNAVSDELPVTSGVPQGSVLGPTLFIYYINDLPEVTNVPTKIFADDTKSFNEIKTIDDSFHLQNAIDNMVNWTDDWMLYFNNTKCKVLHVGKNNPSHNYTIGDNQNKINLPVTESEKDLGVYIDPKLNFEEHISQISKKTRRLCGMVVKSISFKDPQIMVPIFTSFIRPILEYGNVVWFPYKRKDINKIEDIQRSFTRFITGMNGLDYEQRLSTLKLPSLEFRRIRGDMIEVYKILHEIYDPLSTTGLLNLAPESLPTRTNSMKLTKIRTNNNQFHFFFSNRITNLWNSLPVEIACAKNLNVFKNRIDVHLKDYMYVTNIKIYV